MTRQPVFGYTAQILIPKFFTRLGETPKRVVSSGTTVKHETTMNNLSLKLLSAAVLAGLFLAALNTTPDRPQIFRSEPAAAPMYVTME